jgi:hypothetical protein
MSNPTLSAVLHRLLDARRLLETGIEATRHLSEAPPGEVLTVIQESKLLLRADRACARLEDLTDELAGLVPDVPRQAA